MIHKIDDDPKLIYALYSLGEIIIYGIIRAENHALFARFGDDESQC